MGVGRLFDVDPTHKALATIPSHPLSWCEDLAFAADGTALAVAFHDGSVRLYPAARAQGTTPPGG